MTVCPIRGVDAEAGRIEVAAIDAFDGTTVLDVKPYYPSVDRVRDARVPAWLPGWGEWAPEGGFGLDE
jgi:tRNA (Thr-GGU) A37 N-methylase